MAIGSAGSDALYRSSARRSARSWRRLSPSQLHPVLDLGDLILRDADVVSGDAGRAVPQLGLDQLQRDSLLARLVAPGLAQGVAAIRSVGQADVGAPLGDFAMDGRGRGLSPIRPFQAVDAPLRPRCTGAVVWMGIGWPTCGYSVPSGMPGEGGPSSGFIGVVSLLASTMAIVDDAEHATGNDPADHPDQ